MTHDELQKAGDISDTTRGIYDEAQVADMTAIDQAFAQFVQWVGVWHVGAKGLAAIEAADREPALEAAIRAVDEIPDRMNAISERIQFTSQDGHAQVSAWLARMGASLAKMGRVVDHMPAVFSQKESK